MKKIFVIVVLGVLFVLCVGNNNAMAERGKIVSIISDDFLNKKSETEYFFQKKDLSLMLLEHIGNSPPRPGQRAILLPNGKLRYSKNKAGITFNKVSGKINVLIALIQPLDEKDAPWEAEKAKEYFQSSKDFFEDSRQHSQVELSLEIVGWLKSQKTKSELTSSSGRLSPSLVYDEAINLTDDFVNYNEVDCLFIVVAENSLNWTWHSASATVGKSPEQTNDGVSNFSYVLIGSGFFSGSPRAISHELGHAILSFYHSGGKDVSRGNGCGYFDNDIKEDGDSFDVMGNYYFFFSALRQYLAGWLLKERVITLFASASVELHPREIINSNGKQLVIIEINDKEFYSLELFIKELERNNANKFIGNGLLLRHHDGGWYGYDSVVFLQKDNSDESFLHPGEEICGLGAKGEISIKYVSFQGEGEEARAKVEIEMPESTPYPTPTPSPTPTPTPTPKPSPTPTPTPTPCEPDIIRVSPNSIMNMKRKTSGKATVTIMGASGCAVEGETVKAIVTSASGQKRIAVSPLESETDENGQAVFTITANKKTGKAVVAFWAGNLKTFLYVKVSKK